MPSGDPRVTGLGVNADRVMQSPVPCGLARRPGLVRGVPVCRLRRTWSSHRWTRNDVFELIRDRLADILEIEPDQIREGDSFADDLEADSLALIELVEALEEELGERTVGFRIEDEDLQDLKSVRDAVDYVHGKVGDES